MKNKLLLAGLLTSLFLSGSVRSADGPAWKEFTSKEGGFSALMPRTPTKQTKAQKSLLGTIDLTMFLATTPKEGTAYLVAYADYPKNLLELANEDELLEMAQRGGLQGVKGKLVSEKKIKLGDDP